MAIREVLLSNTFEQQRQLINLIGTDVGDCATLVTPSKVVSSSINQVVAGAVTLSGQTIQLEDGSLGTPSLSFDSATNLGLYKHNATTIGFNNSLFVNGSLTVNGDITFKAGDGSSGTLSFGDVNTDNIVFNADINSNVIPNTNNFYDLGSSSQKWKDIYIGSTATINTLSVGGDATITGDLAVNGGDITTTAGSFNLLSSPTTISGFTGATLITLGSTTGTLTLRNPTIVGSETTQNLFNTVATTVNAFGAASEIFMGVTLGGGVGSNSNFTIRSDDTILIGDLNVNGGEILSSQDTFDLLINNSDVRIGSAAGTGSTVINNSLKIKGTTLDLTNQGVVISLKDNLNPALAIREGSNDYLSFQTSDSLEKIVAYKDLTLLSNLSGTSASFTGNLTASGVTVNGNLIVNGTTTTINSTVLSIDDVNIILADGNTTDAGANGGGITLKASSDKTLTYNSTTNRWETNIGLTINGLTDLKQISETSINAFNTTLSPSTGTLTVDTSLGTVVLGDLDASVTTWAFTNVPTANSKATTVTLIIDGDTAQTYGDACSVNGSAITGGVKWVGGSAPTATNNFDIITFTIVRDSNGTVNVFGSGNTNFS